MMDHVALECMHAIENKDKEAFMSSLHALVSDIVDDMQGEPERRRTMMKLDASMLSKARIREKKNKLKSSEPELIGTSPVPDMNAQDVYDLTQKARIEDTLDTPPKIDADNTMMNESYQGVGVSPTEMGRMERLRKYLDSMDL